MTGGRSLQQLTCGGMVEAHDRADQVRRGTASAVTQQLVSIAHLHARQREEVRDRRAGVADQAMSLTVGYERKVARLEQVSIGTRHFDPAPARGHDVEHHAVLQGRNRQAPRRREIGARVERAAHPEEVQRFTERVGGPRVRHAFAVRAMFTLADVSGMDD